MRKNLHPEWGYLASAPSLSRTIPSVLLGMVIGVTASGGVVLSLVDQPASQTSAVARTLAPPVRAAPTPVSAPEIEQPAEVHPDEAAAKPTTPPTTVAAPVESKAIKKHHVVTHYYAPRGGLFGFVPSEHHTNGTWGEPYREGHLGRSYQNGRGSYHASGY